MKTRHLIPALLCALLIAYPLSIGPVDSFYYKRERFPSWVGTLYFPLNWACAHSETLKGLYEWYIELWMNRAHPKIVPHGRNSN